MSSSSPFDEFAENYMALMDVKRDEIRKTLEMAQSQWKEMEELFDCMEEEFRAKVNNFRSQYLEEMSEVKKQALSLKLDMAGIKLQQLGMKEMRLDERESELERREKLLEEKYESSRKKQKCLGSTTSDEEFILFVSCHADDLSSVREEVKMKLKQALNPAKLVLDTLEWFNRGDLEESWGLGVARRICMVLVEVLWEVEPEIGVLERERATRMALVLKEKLNMEDKLEVLGFLQVLLSYRLTDACDLNELLEFIEAVEDKLSVPMLKDIFCHFVPKLI